MLVNGAVYAAGQRLKAIELDHAALPLLEFIGKLHGGRVPPVCYSVQKYFRDVHDHLARTVMNLESLRHGITTATQMNLSIVTIDETEVTKRFAAWAAIFAASTALAGIWAMNFEHMPELSWSTRNHWSCFRALVKTL